MKIGIISDIHGNLIALKTILKHIENETCDYIYFLGDNIAIGPYPEECINLILDLPNAKCLLGNHEEYFINGVSDNTLYPMGDGEKIHQLWVASLLNNDIKNKLKKLPYIINEELDGVKVSFLHYALDNNKNKKTFKSIEKNITSENMDILFSNINSDVIFYGHEHSPSNIKGKKHYINVGSSGCTKTNHTHYTTVEFLDGCYEIKTHKLKYDRNIILDELVKRNVPEKEFISQIFFGNTITNSECT